MKNDRNSFTHTLGKTDRFSCQALCITIMIYSAMKKSHHYVKTLKTEQNQCESVVSLSFLFFMLEGILE